MKKKKIISVTSILSESINLQFDSEVNLLTSKLLKHAKLKIACCLLVKEKPSKYGNQQYLKNLGLPQEKSNTHRASLKWKNNLITKRDI